MLTPNDPSYPLCVSLPDRGGLPSSRALASDPILAASLRLAHAAGETALTLRAIAARCGVSILEVRDRVPSKDALLAEIREHSAEQLGVWLDRDPEAGASALEQLCGQYVAFACQHPRLYRIMLGSAPLTRRNAAVDVFTRRARRLLGGASSARALQLWVAIHGLALSACDLETLQPEPRGAGTPVHRAIVIDYIRAMVRCVDPVRARHTLTDARDGLADSTHHAAGDARRRAPDDA